MHYVSLGLFIVALMLMQILIGGAGLVFSLPASIILGFSGLLLLFESRKSSRGSMTLWTGGSTLLFASYIIARTQFSPVEYLARWDLFLALGALVAYFATSCYFVTSRDRLIVVCALLGLALVHVGIGGIQFKQEDEFMLMPGIIRSYWGWRASGFYICPNHLAGLLEMLGLMALSICCWGRVPNWARILAGYCALMSIAGIAISGSRGGYLSTVFGLLIFCGISLWTVRQVRPDRLWPMLVAVFLGVALLVGGTLFVMFKSDSMSKRLAQLYDPTNMRPLMWKASLEQFHLNPAVGTGAGSYHYYGRQFRSPDVQADPIHVHNDYLELLAEYGAVGAALGAVFLLVHLGAGWGGLKKIVNWKLKPDWRISSNELALLAGALSGIAALLMHSVVDFNFHIPANILLGGFLFAILATPSADLKAVGEAPRRGVRWLPWLAPAMAVALLATGIPLMKGEYFGERARRALRDRHYEEARVLAERAIGFERKNPDLFFTLAQARHYLTLEVKDPVGVAALHEQAAEAYEEGLKLFPRDTRLLLKLGQTLDLAGRFEEAEAIYQRAIEGDPNFGNVYAYYGVHFQRQRRFKEAESYFHKAKKLGEWEISDPALREIGQFRNSEFGKRVLSATPEERSEPEPPAPPPAQ